ncbi:hypothetical protein BBK82_13605 [Lentzea guizhouensis]|uniref:DUF5753 domain-containing protein n=2 Tax=Lentzea guizhouensis TaxID=1586287 RepID=A0A1B2HGW2_9PSEU|nr:hypothetical protein BBK82_13605 [Lentzea guizhouensis]
MGWSAAKLSMMHNAGSRIFEVDVLTLALHYGVDADEQVRACHTAQRAADLKAWEQSPKADLPCLTWTLAELEAEAATIQIVAGEVVPELLRTPAYGSAVRLAQAPVMCDYFQPYDVGLQQSTLALATAGAAVVIDVYLAEAALRRVVGGKRVMADQLLYLVALSEYPGIRIRVVPDAVGAYAGMGTAFSYMTFHEERFGDVVAVQRLHGVGWREERRKVSPYGETVGRLDEIALDVEASRELLAAATTM